MARAQTKTSTQSPAEKRGESGDKLTEQAPSANVRTKVLVLYTGGTIGMVHSEPGNKSSPLVPGSATELSRYIQREIEGVWWDLASLTDEKGEPLRDKDGNEIKGFDSSSVGPDHWGYMAAAIKRNYEKYDGFVILHGTDTMAFTASALSFLLQDLEKPVIITGSQLPIAATRTDAVMNFINALQIAGWKATGLPKLQEVAICFGDALLRGNRTTKVSTSAWQGFDTPNFPRLGSIGEHIVINERLLQVSPEGRFVGHTKMHARVATINLYPGMSAKALSGLLSLEGVNGFVLRSFGTGNAPDDKDFLDVLKSAIDGGKIVVNTTQCVEGMVEMGLYAASSGLQAAGVLTGLDLTSEAALTKLMWVLSTMVTAKDDEGQREELIQLRSELRLQLQRDLRGEQSGSVVETEYLPPKLAVTTYDRVVRPAIAFRREGLKSAAFRIEGLNLTSAGKGEPAEMHVFINLPNATIDMANDQTPQYAGAIAGEYKGAGETNLFLDVTRTVARVCENDGPIRITLVPVRAEQMVLFERAVLSLYNTDQLQR